MPSIINATTTNGVAISPDNSGELRLQTNNGTTAMTITTGQNVGIGTSSPAAKLDVRGSSTFLVNATNPTAWISVDSALTTGSMYNQWNTTANAGIWGTYTNHPVYFVTNNTERMRIDSSGNVGIGTSSPSSLLHLSASVTNSGGTGTEILRVANTRVNTNSSGAALRFVTNEVAGTNQYTRAQITGEYDDASDVNGRLLFATTNTSGTLIERGRFDASGNFRFNSGYGSVATAYGCRAWVNFNGGNGNTAGAINANGNVSSVTANGTGDYTVNFTTAMPDANYSVQCSGQRENTGSNVNLITNVSSTGGTGSIATGSVRVGSANDGGTSVNCFKYCVAVFR